MVRAAFHWCKSQESEQNEWMLCEEGKFRGKCLYSVEKQEIWWQQLVHKQVHETQERWLLTTLPVTPFSLRAPQFLFRYQNLTKFKHI